MTRFVLAACCVLLPCCVSAAVPVPRAKPPAGLDCPPFPVECQVNAPVFNFGRGEMTSASPPIYSQAVISVTCTRREAGYDVDVAFELHAIPPAPARQMRDREGRFLSFDMFVDSTRKQYWGDGSQGTRVFEGSLFLNDRNRVGTLVFPLYGQVNGAQYTEAGQYLGAVIARVAYEFACHAPNRGGRTIFSPRPLPLPR
jgi:spore coat protein U-like protein